jgi:hypothetical protein
MIFGNLKGKKIVKMREIAWLSLHCHGCYLLKFIAYHYEFVKLILLCNYMFLLHYDFAKFVNLGK